MLHGGRLVKLLGDGAMLRLGNATVGVEAALDLVETMTDEGALSPHAGINAGPVIERTSTSSGRPEPGVADRGRRGARRGPRERSGR